MTLDPEPGRPVDWERIDLLLISKNGFKPWELDRLTLSEVAVCLEDPDVAKPPNGAVALSGPEMEARRQWLVSMTAVERMRAAQRGEL